MRQKTLNNDGEQKRRLDFLDILLQQSEDNQMSVEEVREQVIFGNFMSNHSTHLQVDTFLFAGHDTTSHAISWTIWCLATNPDKQERLHRELIDVFGQSDAEFYTNKLKDLKYLEAVIKGKCFWVTAMKEQKYIIVICPTLNLM
jgi:cytochrome P450